MTSHNLGEKFTSPPSVTLGRKSQTPTEITSQASNSPFKKAVIIACRNKSDFSLRQL